MRASLIMSVVEIDKNREPGWAAAQRHLDAMSDAAVSAAVQATVGYDPSIEDSIDVRQRATNALAHVRSAWIDGDRFIHRWDGHRTDMLIAGEVTFADSECESVDDLILFAMSGMAQAAGFLDAPPSDDNEP